MPELSLSQAAKITGKSKSTINRAIKTGKISATRYDDGSYSIDTAELTRAFSVEPQGGAKRRDTEPGEPRLLERIGALESMLAHEREISDDLKEDWGRWRQQVTALLAPPPKRRGWWSWGS